MPDILTKTLSLTSISRFLKKLVLYKETFLTITPEKSIGFNSATGVIIPVLPTEKFIFFTSLIFSFVLNFNATAHLGYLDVKPIIFC